jgi:hypothetical protein
MQEVLFPISQPRVGKGHREVERAKFKLKKLVNFWEIVSYFKQIDFCLATIYSQTIPGKLGMSAFQGL